MPPYELDPRAVELGKAIDALPNILQTNVTRHQNHPVNVYFVVENGIQDGLFFLTRCTDRRYWKFGNKWTLELNVSDTMHDKEIFPTIFWLMCEEGTETEQALVEAKSLVENLNYHLNHKEFMENYYFDLTRFQFKDDELCRKNGYMWINGIHEI